MTRKGTERVVPSSLRSSHRVAVAVVLGGAMCAWSGCRAGGTGSPAAPPGVSIQRLAVTSNTFPSNGAIPVDSTCDGVDRSPQLTFSAPPRATRSLAIVVDDPDSSSGMFTHWTVYDLRPDTLSLPEGADVAASGGESGMNDFGRPGYAGPCPPRMGLHPATLSTCTRSTRR